MSFAYLICVEFFSKGCSLSEIWDLEAPRNRESPPLCDTLLTMTVDHFYPLFRNAHYALFRIHDLSMRLVYLYSLRTKIEPLILLMRVTVCSLSRLNDCEDYIIHFWLELNAHTSVAQSCLGFDSCHKMFRVSAE